MSVPLPFTDIAFILLSLFLFYRGWNKGFFRTLLGPICLGIGLAGGYIYNQMFQQALIALAISIFSPFILTIILSSFFKLWDSTVNKGEKVSGASRFGGATFNFIWGGSIFAMILTGLILFPFSVPGIQRVKSDIENSYTFVAIEPLASRIAEQKFMQNIPTLSANDMQSLQDPEKLNQLQETQEFQAVYQDPAIQEIMNDPEIQQYITDGNFQALISNPKVLSIAQDPSLVQKMLKMYTQMGTLNETETH